MESYPDAMHAIKVAEVLAERQGKPFRVEAVGQLLYVAPITDAPKGVICEVLYPSEIAEQRQIENGQKLARGWECPACGMGLAPTEKSCRCHLFRKVPKR